MEHQQHGEEGKYAVGSKSDLVTLRLKKKTVGILLLVILLLAVGYAYKGFFIAATVDGAPITRLAVIRALEKSSGKQVLDSLVVEQLVTASARKNGVVVSENEITVELSKIEEQVKAQGGTLDQALLAQGMTLETLKSQIRVQKTLEKLIPDKIEVTDVEVAQYIKSNKIVVPSGQEEKYNTLVREQLTQQKLNAAKQSLVSGLRAHATIRTFVSY
jgi:foldase protein PrsA